MFEKKQLGRSDQYDLMNQGYYGATGVPSQMLHVIHGNGRFAHLWKISPGGNGAKTVDGFYLSSAAGCIQFIAVTETSMSRRVMNNTAKLDGKQLFEKSMLAVRGAKKIEAEDEALKVNGNYSSGSNPASRCDQIRHRMYNKFLDQKALQEKKETSAKKLYDTPGLIYRRAHCVL